MPPENANPPGLFHRLTGVPLSQAFRPFEYKADLQRDYQKALKTKEQLVSEMALNGEKIQEYQVTARQNQNALKWAFTKAVLHGVVDELSSGFYFEDFATTDVNDGPIDFIAKGRIQQHEARVVLPEKIAQMQSSTKSLKSDLAANEAIIKRTHVQLKIAGVNV